MKKRKINRKLRHLKNTDPSSQNISKLELCASLTAYEIKDVIISHLDQQEKRAVSTIKTNPKFFYSYAKRLAKSKSSVAPLKNGEGVVKGNHDNNLTNNAEEKAELLQAQYVSVFSDPAKADNEKFKSFVNKVQDAELSYFTPDDIAELSYFTPDDIAELSYFTPDDIAELSYFTPDDIAELSYFTPDDIAELSYFTPDDIAELSYFTPDDIAELSYFTPDDIAELSYFTPDDIAELSYFTPDDIAELSYFTPDDIAELSYFTPDDIAELSYFTPDDIAELSYFTPDDIAELSYFTPDDIAELSYFTPDDIAELSYFTPDDIAELSYFTPDDIAELSYFTPDDIAELSYFTPDDIAELSYFTPDDIAELSYFTPDDIAELSYFTPDDIAEAIKELDPYSAASDIPAKIICDCRDSLSVPLWMLWKRSLDTGIIPTDLKLQYITTIFKKGNRTKAVNYRSVSLTSHIIKIFERKHLVRGRSHMTSSNFRHFLPPSPLSSSFVINPKPPLNFRGKFP